MSDLSLSITDIPEPLRHAADVLADRARRYGEMADTQQVPPEWTQARIASCNVAIAVFRHPLVWALARVLTGQWPKIRVAGKP